MLTSAEEPIRDVSGEQKATSVRLPSLASLNSLFWFSSHQAVFNCSRQIFPTKITSNKHGNKDWRSCQLASPLV